MLLPGSVVWKCSDDDLGLAVELQAAPLITPWGFVAAASVSPLKADTKMNVVKDVTLQWQFCREPPERRGRHLPLLGGQVYADLPRALEGWRGAKREYQGPSQIAAAG